MIIGEGLLATAFASRYREHPRVTIFASGVSNSSERALEPYAREEALLRDTIARAPGPIVYFSTCSLTDPDRLATPYVDHKAAMEALVLAHPGSLVFRLPQVVGRTPNPHTLTNFLARRILDGESFTLWANAHRSLIDVDDVARICAHVIEHPTQTRVLDIADPHSLSMREIVSIMERVLGKTGIYASEDAGGRSHYDAGHAAALAKTLGIGFGPGYAERVLRKYYGDQQ